MRLAASFFLPPPAAAAAAAAAVAAAAAAPPAGASATCGGVRLAGVSQAPSRTCVRGAAGALSGPLLAKAHLPLDGIVLPQLRQQPLLQQRLGQAVGERAVRAHQRAASAALLRGVRGSGARAGVEARRRGTVQQPPLQCA
jgi:hypothetical protein